jgi:hypothetical protein
MTDGMTGLLALYDATSPATGRGPTEVGLVGNRLHPNGMMTTSSLRCVIG